MIQEIIKIHPSARTWIYQSEQVLDRSAVEEIERRISSFLPSWSSHQRPLTSFGSVWHDRFVVIMVDQREVGASGCSMDTLTHFIQSLERDLGISLFNRNTVAYRDVENGPVKTMDLSEMEGAFHRGEITEDTLVFDNLVDTFDKFQHQWVKPLKDSWHKRFL